MALILRSAVAHQTISPGLYKVVEKFLVCDMKTYKCIPIEAIHKLDIVISITNA